MNIKGEIGSYTISVGDFNMSFTSMYKSFKQKTQKETLVLNAILDLMDFTDTYRTFFSHAHRTFSNVDQLLGHKTNLRKSEKNESITNIFYNHNVMRIEINYQKKKKKLHKNKKHKLKVT